MKYSFLSRILISWNGLISAFLGRNPILFEILLLKWRCYLSWRRHLFETSMRSFGRFWHFVGKLPNLKRFKTKATNFSTARPHLANPLPQNNVFYLLQKLRKARTIRRKNNHIKLEKELRLWWIPQRWYKNYKAKDGVEPSLQDLQSDTFPLCYLALERNKWV